MVSVMLYVQESTLPLYASSSHEPCLAPVEVSHTNVVLSSAEVRPADENNKIKQ